MFQSIQYRCYLGYDDATKLYSYEYKLIDSDFSCIAHGHTIGSGPGVAPAGAVIQEYGKRKLNVAANLIRCLRFCDKRYGLTIANQMAWTEKNCPLFTPQLKTELDKYLTLI
jgi:hypothetical protein